MVELLDETGRVALVTIPAVRLPAHVDSTVDQAAVATGNMLFWPVFFGLGGSLFIITAFVAQFYGAKRTSEIGPLLKQAFWLCLPLIILVSIYLSFADRLLEFFQSPEEVRVIAKSYLNGLLIGTPALFLFQPLKSFSEGITRPCLLYTSPSPRDY